MTTETKPVATCQTSLRGNLALQTETFLIPVLIAKEVAKVLRCTPGSYWESTLLKPTRRAVRGKLAHVKIFTAGFGSGELSNAIASVGCELQVLPDAQ